MNEQEKRCHGHFKKMFDHQWGLNQKYRDQYDDDLEYYVGNRDEAAYPLQYKLTFPQLLPRVLSMLSKMLEHIYQGGSKDLVSVSPRKKSDIDRAPRVQGLLNFQLENLNAIDQAGSSYMLNMQWMTNALAFGKGITKLYWRKEERIAPLRVQVPTPVFDNVGRLVRIDVKSVLQQAPQIAYDGPYAEVIHNKLCVPHPNYRSIQQMPGFFVVYRKSIQDIAEKVDKGIYLRSALEDIVINSGGSKDPSAGDKSYEGISKSVSLEGIDYGQFSSEYSLPSIDIYEGYSKYIFPEDEVPYEVGSGIKIKGKESEAICHFTESALLKIQKNNYGYRPFFDISCIQHPESYWDLGFIRIGKDIQEQLNTLGNTRYQNAIMSVNQMLKVRADADIPPESLIWKPFGLVPVDDMNDVQPLLVNDMTTSGVFREQEQFFKDTISDMTGLYPYNMGSTPERQEHVGTIYSLQAVGEARTKLLLMTMDYQGFQPFLRYMMLLNTWHLPDDFESRVITNNGTTFTPMFPGDIHPGYDFSVRYTSMEPSLGKQFRAQQLIQYAQMWVQSPYLQQYEFMRAIMELMDLHDPERFLITPQQVAAQQQQALQTKIQLELGKAQLQDAMQARDDQRTIEREVVKGILS
jgi:hypothetical protein